MGFLDRLRGSDTRQEYTSGVASAAQVSAPATRQTSASSLLPQGHQVGPYASWVPPGQAATIAGYPVPGGMVYMGQQLETGRGHDEPSLINPQLPIDGRRPDWEGLGLGYWPSYDSIPPSSRAAYLTWLHDGRRYAAAPIGYVFLFLYGLERRMLVDLPANPSVGRDLGPITDEVQRLLTIYGGNGSFRRYAGEFLALLRAIQADNSSGHADRVPALAEDRWEIPMELRLGLGEFAETGKAIPADWARAWAWYLPNLYPRTPQTRCPREFHDLFVRRYHERFGDGLVLRQGKSRLKISYRTASSAIGSVTAQLDLPDVFDRPAPAAKLTELVDSVTDELDAYSRWLGRNPDSEGSLAAAALLPVDLIPSDSGPVQALRTWCERHLADGSTSVADGAELIGFWPTATPGRMVKAEAVAMAQLLGTMGFGLEPDVRLGGPVLAPGTAVLFRAAPKGSHSASAAYTAATTLLHLAVAVSAADGQVSEHETTHLIEHLRSALHLTEDERTRLRAHLMWLSVSELKLTGLKKRLDALDVNQRTAIGNFLITVAAADGVVSPAEVTTLTKIFKLLGLDPAQTYSRIHEHLGGHGARPARHVPAATEPVTVRPGGGAAAGFALPATPPPARAEPRSSMASIALDEELIATRLAETAAVSALLATVFVDDDAPAVTDEPRTPAAGHQSVDSKTDTVDPVIGLDQAHSHLLRDLAAKPSWTRFEFEQQAARLGLMPSGALDVINEAVLDLCGEPFADGDDDLTINTYALEELSR
ncbi:TerB N-terminal domain-containing protein [Catellatospora citrea]|uniref:tellurite resistance TerB family protein n=1 Tax=Catellatospora citrea TaxID=53366 RepID=UPI0033E72458